MDWQSFGRLALGALPALVALVGVLSGPGALRSKLRHDIEMLEKLPKDSSAHRRLLQYIDAQVERFANLETESSRDWNGLVGGFVSAVVLWAGFLYLIPMDTWWSWILGVLVGLFALVAMILIFESAAKVPRNPKGVRIKA